MKLNLRLFFISIIFSIVGSHYALGTQVEIIVFDFIALSEAITNNDCLAYSALTRQILSESGSFAVVSALQLKADLDEYQIRIDDKTSEVDALQIGKLVNINNAILGSVDKSGDTFKIEIKSLDLETGKYIVTIKQQAKNPKELTDKIKAAVGALKAKLETVYSVQLGNNSEGDWIVDKKTGFKAWNPNPVPNESISWSGGSINGKADGNGVFIWFMNNHETERFEGEFRSGRPQKGIYSWITGDGYAGELRDWEAHGKGTFYWANGEKYIGEFTNGNINGYGIKYWPNGDIYEGEWVNWLRQGKGTFYRINGDKYVGSFKNSDRNGYGIQYGDDGNIYEGEWVNSSKRGKGVFKYANGDKYEGDFFDDQFNGQGTFYFQTGDKFEGQWKNSRAVTGWYFFVSGEKKAAYQEEDGTWQIK